MPPVFVRTASKPDLAAIRELLSETWHATYDTIYGAERVDEIVADWHSMTVLESRLDKQLSEFVVADDGANICGVAYASSSDGTKTVLLHQLYVRPAQQGRGIGTLLLDEIEGCFPDADKVRLEVEVANAQAVAFYIAQGFARVGRTANCGRPDSGIPADIYERPILWAD